MQEQDRELNPVLLEDRYCATHFVLLRSSLAVWTSLPPSWRHSSEQQLQRRDELFTAREHYSFSEIRLGAWHICLCSWYRKRMTSAVEGFVSL